MSKRVENKVAIVVGGGQTPGQDIGNGRATAILLARNGAKVMVTARHLNRAQQTVNMITQEGGEAFPFVVDATVEEQCKAMVAACVEKYGRVDIMVYNAGISLDGDLGPETISEETWDKVMDVNLKGALFAARAVLPQMKAQQSGVIIPIASVAGFMMVANMYPQAKGRFLAYSISKRGLVGLGHHLAAEYAADGIRVNSIILGSVRTALVIEPLVQGGQSREAIDKWRDSTVPLKGGQGTGWDTAYAVLFLASDEAKFITGAELPVDGGMVNNRV